MKELFSEANKIEMEVYALLKKVLDPELAVNIVDLGLIYKIQYSDESGIQVEMTLSSKGCPMGDVIMQDVEATLKNKYSDKTITITLVWEPGWNADFVTPEGKKLLGLVS